jgi:hypothetical protein
MGVNAGPTYPLTRRTDRAAKICALETRQTFSSMAAIAFVAGLALFFTVPAFSQLQADSFRDLYLGQWIAHHGIPHVEVFAIANRGRPWIDQQWLSDLISFTAWKLAGYRLLALLNAGAFAGAYAMLAGLMRRRGTSAPLTIAFASFAMVSAFTLVFIRAQMLALPLFPALLWLCLADAENEQARWWVWLVIPLLALWGNLHGSVLLGAAVGSAYLLYRSCLMLVRRRVRSAVVYGGLAVAAVLTLIATPYGTGIVHYYREFAGNGAVRAADLEWAPPAFPALSFFQFVVPLALAFISTAVAWSRGRRPSLIVVGAVVLSAVASGLAMRNNVWLGMAAALLLAETASSWIPTQAPRISFLRTLTVLAAIFAVVGVVRLSTQASQRFEVLAPQRAINAAATYATAHPCSRVLADILSVSALLWHDPSLAGRVAFDGRIEAYPQSALRSWVAFQNADGPRAFQIASTYPILIGSSRFPTLVRRLAALPGGTVLGRGSHGIAVLNHGASSGCEER